jgi:molybdate transport system regulatory protein
MPLKNNHSIMCRLWIKGENGAFLGEGRVALLEAIKKHGSISGASRSMSMSYRKAWELVDSMNKEFGTPLVLAVSGGKNGGGAQVTPSGDKIIKNFLNFRNKCMDVLNREIENYDFT